MQPTFLYYIRFLSFLALCTIFAASCGERNGEDMAEEPLSEAPVLEETEPDPDAFGAWDTDQDAYVNESEFGLQLENGTWWTTWDTDGDRYLTREEYDAAFSEYGWYDATQWEQWDTDGDGRIGLEEWESGLFSEWDADDDNRLGENEFDLSLFE